MVECFRSALFHFSRLLCSLGGRCATAQSAGAGDVDRDMYLDEELHVKSGINAPFKIIYIDGHHPQTNSVMIAAPDGIEIGSSSYLFELSNLQISQVRELRIRLRRSTPGLLRASTRFVF